MPRRPKNAPSDLDRIADAREAVGDGRDPIEAAYTARFRTIHHRYARQVSDAYGGDFFAAMCSTDAEVAARVRAFEIAEGLEPSDWAAVGRKEREEE